MRVCVHNLVVVFVSNLTPTLLLQKLIFVNNVDLSFVMNLALRACMLKWPATT